MANQAKAALEAESLEAFADRGYFKGEEILACDEAGITVTLPKPQTSEAKSEGRFVARVERLDPKINAVVMPQCAPQRPAPVSLPIAPSDLR